MALAIPARFDPSGYVTVQCTVQVPLTTCLTVEGLRATAVITELSVATVPFRLSAPETMHDAVVHVPVEAPPPLSGAASGMAPSHSTIPVANTHQSAAARGPLDRPDEQAGPAAEQAEPRYPGPGELTPGGQGAGIQPGGDDRGDSDSQAILSAPASGPGRRFPEPLGLTAPGRAPSRRTCRGCGAARCPAGRWQERLGVLGLLPAVPPAQCGRAFRVAVSARGRL